MKSTYISTGGATTWQNVENGDILKFTIEGAFTQSNTFEGNFDRSGTFELTDGVLILAYQEHNEEKHKIFLSRGLKHHYNVTCRP